METYLQKYAERKMPFYFMVLSLWVHKSVLEQTIGIGFTESLFIHESGICKLFGSKKEIEMVKNRTKKLIKTKEHNLGVWYEKAKLFNKQADELLLKYQSGHDYSVISLDEAFQVLIDNGGLCTILPYWVLYSINEELERGESREKFGKILKMYEELKSETRYPQIAKVVFSNYIKKASKILGVSYDLATCLHPTELREIILNQQKISINVLNKRMNSCGITRGSKPYDVNYIFDKKILERYKDNNQEQTELRGKTAYPGKVSGVAKLINDIDDMTKFKEGDILVSFQSSPALMPSLRKCVAIVTDEGGIMCHASIIARELKKPCVIGTKIATQVLKDGMMVEVDADNGVVRVLNK